MTGEQPAPDATAIEAVVREGVATAEKFLIEKFPDAKCRLEPGDDPAMWHFSIYAESGRVFLPLEVTQELNRLWMEHKVSIITTIYPLNSYQENT